MVDLLAEHDFERYAREDSSLRGADVDRLGIRLPRRREKLFTRKWSFDPSRLARAPLPATTVSQPLQLRCHNRHAITVPIIAGPTTSSTIARKSRSAVATSESA